MPQLSGRQLLWGATSSSFGIPGFVLMCQSFCFPVDPFARPRNALTPRSSLRRCFSFQGDLEGDPDCLSRNVNFCICQQNICLLKPQQFWKQRQLGSWPSNSRTTMAVPQRFAQLPSTTAPLRQRAALRDTVARLARTPRGPLRLRSGRAARFQLWRVGQWAR